jgi:hypothetical protein
VSKGGEVKEQQRKTFCDLLCRDVYVQHSKYPKVIDPTTKRGFAEWLTWHRRYNLCPSCRQPLNEGDANVLVQGREHR